jgi:hypothetical protein
LGAELLEVGVAAATARRPPKEISQNPEPRNRSSLFAGAKFVGHPNSDWRGVVNFV